MTTVILENNETEKIMEHFIAYGYDDFIVFSKIDTEYYLLNKIKVIKLKGFDKESTGEKLQKIKGSLSRTFCVVYSSSVEKIDLEKVEKFHKNHQCLTTLIEIEKCLCTAVFEPEIFDYLEKEKNLEKGALLKIAEDNELQIYK